MNAAEKRSVREALIAVMADGEAIGMVAFARGYCAANDLKPTRKKLKAIVAEMYRMTESWDLENAKVKAEDALAAEERKRGAMI